jgi:adenylate cyclase
LYRPAKHGSTAHSAPKARADHAEAALAFGRAILAEVGDWRKANALELQIRVGMASGSVVGGVIGRRRIVFDLWGETVNTAARMESSGVPVGSSSRPQRVST